MKRKVLSLALALVMCLALTVPAFAAEPYTFSLKYTVGPGSDDIGMVVDITNVLNYYLGARGDYFNCVAPVKLELGEVYDRENCEFRVRAAKISDNVELDVDHMDFWKYQDWIDRKAQGSITLTEPGRYHVEVWIGMPGGSGYNNYLIEVREAGGKAKASTQAVTVDGKAVEFQMYALVDASGNGTNYVKLRDMAYVLNGTKAQFAVGYNNAAKSISLTTGQAYEASGAEMKTPYSGDRAYTGGTQSIQVDGEAVSLEAITLVDDAGGGYNYFKLRDLGKALGFNVGWSKEAGVFIESDQPYSE